MIFAVYLPLMMPALAVPVVRWVAARLHPTWASWLVLVSAVILGVCSTAALGLLMLAALSVMRLFARLGHWSPAEVRHLDAVHLPVDVSASVLLLVFGVMTISAGVRRIRAIVEAYRMASECPDGTELMVLRDDRPLAHALPGRPGRIVVSTTMLASLAPAERRALLAHERAHLAEAHHLFVAVIDVLAAANPLLRPLTGVIRYTTERWADEVAASHVGDRSVVARAVGKAALVAKSLGTATLPGIAMAATAGPVPRRVAALLTPAPTNRITPMLMSLTGLCAIVAFAMTTGSIVSSLDAATDLHRILELAQH
ncbi:MAG TPA: M56 family metallopeptidase [Pseudonocardiaceae bacterium]|nr:M56 family metallopeptidase [Pseudonocardiaceae bacterium]